MKLPNWFVCLGEALMEESKAPAQFTLTAEERWFIAQHIEYLIQWIHENGESISVNQELQTYRALLERTK